MSSNCSLWQENSLSVKHFAFAKFSEISGQYFLLFTLILLMFLVSLTGNALITLAIWTNPALHIPMYFFLGNLSSLEIGYTSSVIPKMLQSLVSEARGISQEGCATQMFFFTLFCCLLAAMDFECYMAILVSWGVGCMVGLGQTSYIFSLYFCGPCEIDHFFCDLPPILALACGDTSHNEAAGFVVAILCISSPFLLIIASYGRILSAVLMMPSPDGHHKALSTCSSHLLIVTLFYGSGSVTYLSLRNKEVKVALRRTLGQRKVLAMDR
uniref:G-protein coupled receptors family 1 profile domain-containing protein n=1 Tax=Nannospalax galili TaxID=1026970 RepID=A0A8C6QNV1_NANGA